MSQTFDQKLAIWRTVMSAERTCLAHLRIALAIILAAITGYQLSIFPLAYMLGIASFGACWGGVSLFCFAVRSWRIKRVTAD